MYATTDEYGSLSRYTNTDTLQDTLADYLGEYANQYDLDTIADEFRDAINTALADTGISLHGRDFYGPYPVRDDAADLIRDAIEAVEVDALPTLASA